MNELAKTQPGTIATQGFSENSLAVSGETMSTALSAREVSKVQARYMVAMQRPRNWETIRTDILSSCKRPNFAVIAWYSLPFGEKVEGFSIRFAEEAARAMGHIHMQTSITTETDTERHVSVEVVDLQNNLELDTTVVVKKTTEKKFLKKGQSSISVRTNAYNEPVYLVEATDAEVEKQQNSKISKAYRNAVLRFLPGDIKEECKDLIIGIRGGRDVEDKVGFRRKIIDAFADVGVSLADLEWYLDHSLDSSSPAELSGLRDMHSDIKEGGTSWGKIEKTLKAERGEKEEPEKAPLDAIADKIKGA